MKSIQDDLQAGIGASEISDVASLEYGCPTRLWYRKRGILSDYEEDSSALERGSMCEPIVKAMFEKYTKRVCRQGIKRVHPEVKEWLCHTDAEWDDAGAPAIAEFKTANYRRFKKFKAEGLPEAYILQAQSMLGITGWKTVSFGILCLDPWSFATFDLHRDEELIQRVRDLVENFWKVVENGPRPEPLPAEDFRCAKCLWRRTCQGDRMLDVIPQAEGGSRDLPVDDSLSSLGHEIQALEEISQEAEAALKDARDRLKTAIGDRPGIRFNGGRAILSRFQRQSWDAKALNTLCSRRADIAEYLLKYKQTTTQATMRIYWT